MASSVGRFKIGSFNVAGVCRKFKIRGRLADSREAQIINYRKLVASVGLVHCRARRRVGLVYRSRCIRVSGPAPGRLRYWGVVGSNHTSLDIAQFCSFLQLDYSDQSLRYVNLHRASQGAPCSALKHGVLPQYHPEPMQAISAVRFARSRKLDLKMFLKGNPSRSSQVFRFPCLKSRDRCLAESS